MKGDYIFCLNPNCYEFSIDDQDGAIPELDSRNIYFRKLMCPWCKGTNTINANVGTALKKQKVLLKKGSEEQYQELKQLGKVLKCNQVIEEYDLYRTRNTYYLYKIIRPNKLIKTESHKRNINIEPVYIKRKR